MDQQDDTNASRKILKPYRHLFSKPITVKRGDDYTKTLFNIQDKDVTNHQHNTCTQTSKTILELAQLDRRHVRRRERSISPDSLCASPNNTRCDRVGNTVARSLVSEADTIDLVKKQSAYNLLHSAQSQHCPQYDRQQQEYYDDLDEYTPEGSMYTPPRNSNTAHNAQYSLKSTLTKDNVASKPLQANHLQPVNNFNMASKHNLYPPLFEHEYIVANAHLNHERNAFEVNQLSMTVCDNSAHAQQNMSSPGLPPDANATATAFLMHQQQLEHKLVDAMFPESSLVNTFLSKSKNRARYAGDQPDFKTKKRVGEIMNRQKNCYNFKSHSYIDSSSSPHRTQNYPARSKFTLNHNDPLNYAPHCIVVDPTRKNDAILLEGDIYSNYIVQPKTTAVSGSKTVFSRRRSNSFMMPTIASERRSCMQEVRQITRLMSPTMRGCSLSPRLNNQSQQFQSQSGIHVQYAGQQCPDDRQLYQYQQMQQLNPKSSQYKIKVPYIDGSICDEDMIIEQRNKIYKEKIRDYSPVHIRPNTPKNSFEEDLLKIDQLSLDVKNSQEGNSTARTTSATSIDSTINIVLTRIKQTDWNIALKGLAEVIELCRSTDASVMSPYMTTVNQRLLDLLRSPRSHVCRTACQAAGHLFESMKDIRKPEFEDIVNTLLHKTADSNKFIRQDANLALDCMVTHISSFHAIKALCSKGPAHKNPLVRSATIRLIICAVVIAGPETILNPINSEYTRKRVIVHLTKFIMDKNLDTRKYAERLLKVLNRERSFDMHVKRILEKEDLEIFKQNIRYLKK